MKKATFLLLATIILVACNGQKNASTTSSSEKSNSERLQLKYTANSRGFFQEIKIENHEVFISNDRNAANDQNPIKIADNDWQQITEMASSLDLEGLPDLKAPTEKRFYDGAAIGSLSVTKNEKTYNSSSFDNGYPPKQIEDLVKKITSYAVKE
jgi:hypothetical protein